MASTSIPNFFSTTPVNKSVEKFYEDKWNASPPQVTSYLTYPISDPPSNIFLMTSTSPNCGLGWRFKLTETSRYQKSSSNPRAQELMGQVALTLQPHMCSSMALGGFKVDVKASYPADGTKSVHEEQFANVSSQSDSSIGTYIEPLGYKGQMHIEVTLTFNASDGLCLLTTPSINPGKALRHSLDGPSFVDLKFYLFSARVRGQPANPKPVFSKSMLLTGSSTYLHDLLSTESGFANGTRCDLREHVPQEIAKLDANTYEYDSDSDLDDEEVVLEKGKGKEPVASSVINIETENGSASQTHGPPRDLQDGRAFAINGTAYRTWKAFIFYTYTNEIQFNALRSQREPDAAPTKSKSEDTDLVGCSPKSMYRFADHADLSQLKSLAKEGIRKSLSKTNIIVELFSSFTSKYQDIIELEVDYLVKNFTPAVAHDLDEMLQLIVLGTKPYCFRVLAFTMRRLRGEGAQSVWGALANDEATSVSPVLTPVQSVLPDPLTFPPTSNLPTPSSSMPQSGDPALPQSGVAPDQPAVSSSTPASGDAESSHNGKAMAGKPMTLSQPWRMGMGSNFKFDFSAWGNLTPPKRDSGWNLKGK